MHVKGQHCKYTIVGVPVVHHLLFWQNTMFLSTHAFCAWKRMWETSGELGLLDLGYYIMDSVILQCT
jgi:hypothetical protein